MGLDRDTLISEAQVVMEVSIANLGYVFEPNPPNAIDNFWFEKKPASGVEVFHILEFQPRGFNRDNFFDLAINLARREQRDYTEAPKTKPARPGLSVRLAPCLWEQSGGATDYWWHFVTVDQLRHSYMDMLDKLIDFGIPFIENPNSTWSDWMAKK